MWKSSKYKNKGVMNQYEKSVASATADDKTYHSPTK